MTEDDIYAVFDAGGVLSRKFPGYEFRDGQLSMSLQVRQAYEKHAILVVEAGTGIGKSFAYLVPALLNAIEHPDERTVVATSTINLQKQLYEKDIPALFSLLGKSCKVALAVGRGNYLCIRRFVAKREDSALLAQDPDSDIYKLNEWARKSQTGLRSDYPGRLGGDIWADINSDGDLCQGFKCPYFQQCFYQKAKQETKDAKLVISNHHLLFSDAAYRWENQLDYDEDAVLPSYSRLVFDEAHNIEENATSYFTEEYDPKELKRQLSIIQRHSGKKPSLLEQLAEFSPDATLADKILDGILEAGKAADTLDQYLVHLFSKTLYQPCLITPALQGRLTDFVSTAKPVWEYCAQLASLIGRFLEQNKAPEEYQPRIKELKVRGLRVQAMGKVLSDFCDFPSWGNEVHWFHIEQERGGDHRAQVRITPLVIAPLLVDAIFKKLDTVVCASATLSLGDNFHYWGGRVGLPYDDVRPFLTGVYPSPFDFPHRLLLLTPEDAPEMDRSHPERYVSYMADTIWNSVLSAGGGTLVLFTSYQMLKAVKEQVADRFAQNGMALLAQGESDRFSLLKRFIGEEDSTLFATSSFWEGVDAPGNTLRMVIIVKLPFQVPTDPVFKARCDAIDRQGGSGFLQLGLPETTMKLKQGFGRLLRNKEDRGVVLVLDSRVVTKSYGISMIRSLPESWHPDCRTDSISSHIEQFLYGA